MQTSLQRKLTQTNFKCVPDGVHKVTVIYQYVQEAYPEMCDDEEQCTTGWVSIPEWQHMVRNALQSSKGKGRVHKTGLKRGYWRIQVNLDDKVIADVCCGARSIWWDKEHPAAVYMDIREEEPGSIELQPNWSVKPDLIGDYRDMVFEDETFVHIMWDLPHILEAKSGIMLKKYGKLGYEWRENTLRGFEEIWRCLKVYGTLALKWCDLSISTSEMLGLFPKKYLRGIEIVPQLHGTRTKKSVSEHGTYWILFLKFPENDDEYRAYLHRELERLD